ncbi:RsmB/NOP family class I SAM-dependent RNA methyltransferase [Curvivirga sp.]|uniref:RsmB/NOP family class I SAM-dependent RNA methyltransferase n=1 Tax=Curvivirga sp. TaxID=2856848 RepID=UPI003B5B8103
MTNTSRNSKNRSKPPYRRREHAEISARLVALRMLRRILDKGQSFDQAQIQLADDLKQLEDRDKGFARAIVLNSLRYKGQLDALAEEFLERPVTGDQGMVAHFLRVGMVQLLILDTPPHAAVGELLSLLDKTSEFAIIRKFKGLINAILGRADREGDALLAIQNAAKLNTPAWIWDSWVRDYGEETAQAMAEANLEEAPIDVSPRHLKDAEKLTDAIDLPGGGQRLPAGYHMQNVPGFSEGHWWVQDLASSLPLKIADKLIGGFDGKTALDLCAAPGGKTMQMAAAGAKVTAVDISKSRLARLHENLDRMGLSADIHVADVVKWKPTEQADIVFVDAPCGATGTMRRHPDLAHIKSQEDVDKLVATQARLLPAAWDMVKSGGYMMYAVCSLQKEEAEHQFQSFMNSLSDGEFIAIPKDVVSGVEDCITDEGLLRCRPDILSEIGGMDGFFAGLIRKKG